MKNVTITLDEKVAQWARVWAAKHNTSVSRMLGDLLADRMAQEEDYHTAMKRYLARKPSRISGGEKLPTREELHERKDVR